MSVEDVMKKALQQAKHSLGQKSSQAFCEHNFKSLFADRLTLEVVERRCEKCGLKQKAKKIWVDIEE